MKTNSIAGIALFAAMGIMFGGVMSNADTLSYTYSTISNTAQISANFNAVKTIINGLIDSTNVENGTLKGEDFDPTSAFSFDTLTISAVLQLDAGAIDSNGSMAIRIDENSNGTDYLYLCSGSSTCNTTSALWYLDESGYEYHRGSAQVKIDSDSNGTETWSVLDGGGTSRLSLTEAGSLTSVSSSASTTHTFTVSDNTGYAQLSTNGSWRMMVDSDNDETATWSVRDYNDVSLLSVTEAGNTTVAGTLTAAGVNAGGGSMKTAYCYGTLDAFGDVVFTLASSPAASTGTLSGCTPSDMSGVTISSLRGIMSLNGCTSSQKRVGGDGDTGGSAVTLTYVTDAATDTFSVIGDVGCGAGESWSALIFYE